MYVKYSKYESIYDTEAMDDELFTRFEFEACRYVDNETTGIDGVRKLRVAYPVDETDKECVDRCICELSHFLYLVNKENQSRSNAAGYIQNDDGTVKGKQIASISSGSESISYTGKSDTEVSTAASDAEVLSRIVHRKITSWLSAVKDVNGVNLLYAGSYPVRL